MEHALTADTALTTEPTPPLGDVWLSISDLARCKNVSKQAISARVARFEAEGLVTPRPGRGGAKFVNLAEYERAASAVSFPAQQLAADTMRHRRTETEPADGPDAAARADIDPVIRSNDPTLTEAQTRKATYEAELKKLDLAERRHLSVPIEGEYGVKAAMTRAGSAFVRALDRLASRSDDLIAAYAKDGHHGHRRLLRQLVTEVREGTARELDALEAIGREEEARGPYEAELPLSEDA